MMKPREFASIELFGVELLISLNGSLQLLWDIQREQARVTHGPRPLLQYPHKVIDAHLHAIEWWAIQ